MEVFEFHHFGADKIKTFNISPDAFVQMALQLGVFKMTGDLCGPPPAPSDDTSSVRGKRKAKASRHRLARACAQPATSAILGIILLATCS